MHDPVESPGATRQALRRMAQERRGVLVAGAFNALSARIAADCGFEAVYLSGAGLTNMHLGLPDFAFMGLRDIEDHTARIRDSISVPLIVDADTGFGNALNVRHTVRVLERAGADAIQLEDQVFPKRCGHFTGKEVAPLEEMLGKIWAAVDARRDPDLLVIARTDARAMLGFEQAVDRARRFAEAGADILFVEAPEGAPEVRLLPKLLDAPQLINIVIGGRTPVLDAGELGKLGFGFVLYANAALQGAVLGMQNALGRLKTNGRLDEDPSLVVSFSERQRLVDKPLYDSLNTRYA